MLSLIGTVDQRLRARCAQPSSYAGDPWKRPHGLFAASAGSDGYQVVRPFRLKRRSRRELTTTLTELKAMAAPAMMGER